MYYYTRLEKLVKGKQFSLLGPFASYEENEVLSIWPLELKSPGHVRYKRAKYAIVLHYTRLKRLARDKQFSLLHPFTNCKENEVLFQFLSPRCDF